MIIQIPASYVTEKTNWDNEQGLINTVNWSEVWAFSLQLYEDHPVECPSVMVIDLLTLFELSFQDPLSHYYVLIFPGCYYRSLITLGIISLCVWLFLLGYQAPSVKRCHLFQLWILQQRQPALNPELANIQWALTSARSGYERLICLVAFSLWHYLILPLWGREDYSMILILQMRKLRSWKLLESHPVRVRAGDLTPGYPSRENVPLSILHIDF